MKSVLFYLIIIPLFLVSATGLQGQIVIRDHRIGSVIRYRPHITVAGPASASDKGVIPNGAGSLPVRPFTAVLRFPGNGPGVIGDQSAVFQSGKLILVNGRIHSSSSEAKGRSLLFYTDTLEMNGESTINLSKNRNNENGFLLISCRILKLSANSMLTIMLSDTQAAKYRSFYLFAEKVFLDDREVFDVAEVVGKHIRHNDQYPKPVYYWSRLRVGETPQTRRPTGFSERPGYKVERLSFNPMKIAIGFLPLMTETSPVFFRYFSEWVTTSYSQLYNRLLRHVNESDKLPAVLDFTGFLALNKYEYLDPAYQERCNEWIQKIMAIKPAIFSSGYQFERTISLAVNKVKVLSTISGDGIINYPPPSLSLIIPNSVNNKPVLGFHTFDESAPDRFYLDFDLTFTTDSRINAQIRSQLTGLNDQLSNTFDVIKFSNLTLESPDIIASSSFITPLSNHTFNIRLCIKADNILVFSKLFSGTGSPVKLNGSWSNKEASITGSFSIPVSFSKISGYKVQYEKGSLNNPSPYDVIIDFIPATTRITELSPALRIKANSHFDTAITAIGGLITIPPDAITYLLNAENYGDYFEQIDNSDRLVQELQIENLVPATAADSLSGQLQFVELSIKARDGDKWMEKKLSLSPAGSSGSMAKLIFPKKSKNAIPLIITGTAFYQNGEYQVSPVNLQNGEMLFNLNPANFMKK